MMALAVGVNSINNHAHLELFSSERLGMPQTLLKAASDIFETPILSAKQPLLHTVVDKGKRKLS